MSETPLKLPPSHWTNTKIAITSALQKAERIAEKIERGNPTASQQMSLMTLQEIQDINTTLERHYWENPNVESDEELNILEKLSFKANQLSNLLKTQTHSPLNRGQLAFQLEVLADLILSIVNGQRITELVLETRKQPFTSEEELEINRILEEALKGEA